MTYLVQSVIFEKSKFSLENAKEWLLSNKYKDKGVDEKKKFWRFRQLNPLTIKRKGYSHYITKPLDHSGVELIIAYKDKMEGAGKLNQIKKALFNHFKKDEKLESQVASTLGRVNKEANDIVKLLADHDKADDKPQSIIKKALSKLDIKNNNNISGKGLKGNPHIYSKDKMTTQEAKLYMSGIMTTGGALDLSQDLAFRLKYSFKVSELRKMLKELVKEKKIELEIKEINKLKKEEIIDMVVKGQLINPPELPTSVALAKKYKLADLKREALEHAGLGRLTKADIINYIEKNNLWKGEEKEKENIQLKVSEIEPEPVKKKTRKAKKKLTIEDFEIEEEPKKEELKLEESMPSGNPKDQMKGIKIGTRVMPKPTKEVKPRDDVIVKDLNLPQRMKLDLTDEDINILLTGKITNSKGKKVKPLFSKIFEIGIKDMNKSGEVPTNIRTFGKSVADENGVSIGDTTFTLIDGKMYLRTTTHGAFGDPTSTPDTIENFSKQKLDFYKTFEEMKQNLPKSKGASKMEQIDKQIRIKEYLGKGYLEVDAIEAVERDLKYNKDLEELATKHGVEEMELPDKPLTKKEVGDQLQREWLNKQAEKARNDPALMSKFKENQEQILKDRKASKLVISDDIVRTMIYKSIDFKDYRKAQDYLNKIRKHFQHGFNEAKYADKPKEETEKKEDLKEVDGYVKLDWTDEEISLLPYIQKNGQTTLPARVYLKALEMAKNGKVPEVLRPNDFNPDIKKGVENEFNNFRLYRNRVYLNGVRLIGYDDKTPEEQEKTIDEAVKSVKSTLAYFRNKLKKENQKK